MRNKRLTATDVASYYRLHCHLALWKVFHHRHLQNPDQNVLTQAAILRGKKWERDIHAKLSDENLILSLKEDDSFELKLVEDARSHFYVTDACFNMSGDLFQNEFRIRNRSPLKFGVLKPDFIEVKKKENLIELHIIEAKASKTVQVYSLALVAYMRYLI
jgi:hypothetical protein